MNEDNISAKNSSTRRTYTRRNRKGNRTNISRSSLPPLQYIPVTTTLLTSNNTLINTSTIPVKDLFVPISLFTQYKNLFIIGLSLLILLCIISILFIFILNCTRIKSCKTRRQERLIKKRLKTTKDFLDEQDEHKDENDILLEENGTKNSLTQQIHTNTNGILLSDNISNTLSLDPMIEQKIMKNNPPNSISLSPMADDISLDTLRGSLISSPSQQISAIQPPPTPTYTNVTPSPITTTATDSIINPDERVVEAEKDDDLRDLELKPRYTKATNNNSSSSLSGHRPSSSALEQTIRKQERRKEEAEREDLFGSNSNLYEKELRRQAEQESFARKQHTNSQVSLVSRTSEDSCY